VISMVSSVSRVWTPAGWLQRLRRSVMSTTRGLLQSAAGDELFIAHEPEGGRRLEKLRDALLRRLLILDRGSLPDVGEGPLDGFMDPMKGPGTALGLSAKNLSHVRISCRHDLQALSLGNLAHGFVHPSEELPPPLRPLREPLEGD